MKVKEKQLNQYTDMKIIKEVTVAQVSQKPTKNPQYVTMGVKVGENWYNNVFNVKDVEKIESLKDKPTTLMFYQEEYNGKMYPKFKIPAKIDLLEVRVEKLEAIIAKK